MMSRRIQLCYLAIFAASMLLRGQNAETRSQTEKYWKKFNGALRQMVQRSTYANQFQEPPLRIDQAAVLRTSRLHVALVNLGSFGASTNGMVLVETPGGVLKGGRLLDDRGKRLNEVLVQGASNGHNDQVELLPALDAVTISSSSLLGADITRMGTCSLRAFHYRALGDVFVFDGRLSTRLEKPFCKAEGERYAGK